jgi:ankyrin repeat protein
MADLRCWLRCKIKTTRLPICYCIALILISILRDGRTMLSWAAENGLHSVVCRLLEKAEIDIHEKDNTGRTVLSYASGKGHTSIVQLILTIEDYDINTKDGEGMNPLLRASFNGHHAIVRLLLEKGNIDVNAKWDNYMSYTSLLLAIQRRHEEVARLLLKKGDRYQRKGEKSWLLCIVDGSRE